jgi:hypothetical protein
VERGPFVAVDRIFTHVDAEFRIEAGAARCHTGAMNVKQFSDDVSLRQALAELGFRPALLDYATMTLYGSRDGLAGPLLFTLVAGFERNGFFYTRTAAERAAREWRGVPDPSLPQVH